jgi:enoyl-CoA hydratase
VALNGRGWAPTERVRFERDGAVGVVVLHRPPANLVDGALVDELLTALDAVERAGWVRCLLLRADGPVFSEGLDPATLRDAGPTQINALVMSLLDIATRIDELPYPTLAVAHGACLSVGLELCLCCDQLWLGTGTRVGLTDARLGLVPLAGGAQRLAYLAGAGVAHAIALGDRTHLASYFVRWGIAAREVAPAALEAEAREYAQRLAVGPTKAYALTKALVRTEAEGLGGADDLLLRSAAALVEGEDAQAGLAAALDGRDGEPRFRGRS